MLRFFMVRALVLSVQYLLKHHISLVITSMYESLTCLKSKLVLILTFLNAYSTANLRIFCSSSNSDSDLSGLVPLFEDVRAGTVISVNIEDIVVMVCEP